MKNKKTGTKPLTPREVIEKRKRNVVNRRYFTTLIRKIILLGVFAYLLFTYVFGITIMPDRAMFPRFNPTDLVLYYRWDRQYVAGDVVVLRKDGKDFVLRVIAIEGDAVDIRENGLHINGATQMEDDIFYDTGIYEEGIAFPVTLGKNEVFLLGDNRLSAKDSRYFGVIKKEEIQGKVFTVLRRTDF